MTKRAIVVSCLWLVSPALGAAERAATHTWNRSALPANATPAPGSYIGTCSSGEAACVADAQCPAGQGCRAGTCKASCRWDTDCPGGQSCTGGTCSGGSICHLDSQCATGQTCGNGHCSVSRAWCRLDSQCPIDQRCQKYLDISFKANNTWYIDHGANGYYGSANPPPETRWDLAYSGYGDDNAIPAPADYDGDGFTDLAVKDPSGTWFIDWSSNGFGGWDDVHGGYGAGTPIPGDYDRDGRADIAVKASNGFFAIDYAHDGFGTWNIQPTLIHGWSYGDGNSIPVPADYDGDGKLDMAIKDNTAGTWAIDYMANDVGKPEGSGRRQWDVGPLSGYGTAMPIPADYDGDGKADIAQKDSTGTWMIDLAPTFGSWDQPFLSGYGGTSKAVPGDYDHDGRTDLSVVDLPSGTWFADYAANGFGSWDTWPSIGRREMPNQSRQLTDPGRPHVVSTAVFDANNKEPTELRVGERYTVDIVLQPGTLSDNTVCRERHIASGGACSLPNGADGTCDEGGACVEIAQVEANPALLASPGLTIHDGSTFWPISKWASDGELRTPFCDPLTLGRVCKPHRRFAISCDQAGSYVLGYQLRNAPVWKGHASRPVNPDYGTKIVCTTEQTGLHGRVTERVGSPQRTATGQPAFYRPGAAIRGARIRIVETNETRTSDATGFWRFENLVGGPYTVEITAPTHPDTNAPTHSDTIAVNVRVPPSGFELDTPLEEPFTPLRASGARYTTYIDYARNRLIIHVLSIRSRSGAAVRLQQAGSLLKTCGALTGPHPNPIACTEAGSPSGGNDQCPHFQTLSSAAQPGDTLAVVNAVWWDHCTGKSLGYMYNGAQMPALPFCDGGTPRPPDRSPENCQGGGWYNAEGSQPLFPENHQPLLGVVGQSRQRFGIHAADSNFFETTGNQWTQTYSSTAIWDEDRDGVSDVQYALQMSNPPLVWDGRVYAYGNFNGTGPSGDYDYVFPRTAVGVRNEPFQDSTLFLVVTDGEGIQGGHGATANQLALFFKDVLHADRAFGLDSGNSTMMLIRGTRQPHPRRVNTLTGEDATVQRIPGLQFLEEKDGSFGAVANFIRVVRTGGLEP